MTLDVVLVHRLRGMPQLYIAFALGRSFTRLYAQWLLPHAQWVVIYWWGELLGYLVITILIANLVLQLLPEHLNTAVFYSIVVLTMVAVVVWSVDRNPMTIRSLVWAHHAVVAFLGFMLFMAVILCRRWQPVLCWLLLGLAANLSLQLVPGLVGQAGFLIMQLVWLLLAGRHGHGK